jgi:formylglycine-generating enzyme required for sulfatase activity
MVWFPGGVFLMGSDQHYPEEQPTHHARVDGFWIDRTPVTNREFRRFVEATGHVTFAEIAPDPKDYPGALPHMLKPGSLVFTPPRGAVDLRDWSQWWKFKFGANWRRPYGPGNPAAAFDEHPVVHVAYSDAEAYAKWAGKHQHAPARPAPALPHVYVVGWINSDPLRTPMAGLQLDKGCCSQPLTSDQQSSRPQWCSLRTRLCT